MLVKQTLVYPFAAALNFFSITALLIITGLLGKGALAADIAVIQGAVIAVFLSLSGNARNLILSNRADNDEVNLFYFRLLIMLPAVIAAVLLAKSIVDVPLGLIAALIIRKCTEWLAELQLANREKANDFLFANRYVQINTVGLSALVLMLLFSWMDAFYLILYVWAILPAVFLWSHIRWILDSKKVTLNFAAFIPHIGSSSVIGITTYIFRILLITLVGKMIAGQMFTAYAIGGVASAIYTYALGPTLILHETSKANKGLIFYILFCVLTGVMVISAALFLKIEYFPPLFIYGIGFSLIGGGIMLLAQRQRLYLLQVFHKDVFVPDALVNILLITSIPFIYYVFGQTSLAVIFLWSALINVLFYISLAYKNRIGFV